MCFTLKYSHLGFAESQGHIQLCICCSSVSGNKLISIKHFKMLISVNSLSLLLPLLSEDDKLVWHRRYITIGFKCPE